MKKRPNISQDVVAELMYTCDRTCCVCHEPRKGLQIHHIDGDTSHNDLDNLAALCLECHGDTQISGGFTRKRLDRAILLKFRKEWYLSIERVRDIGMRNKIAAQSKDSYKDDNLNDMYDHENIILSYIQLEIEKYIKLKIEIQDKYDSGITSEMLDGIYKECSHLENMLLGFADFYPQNNFINSEIIGAHTPNEYFSKISKVIYEWNRLCSNNKGTIAGLLVGNANVEMLKSFVESIIYHAYPLEGNAEMLKKIIARFRQQN